MGASQTAYPQARTQPNSRQEEKQSCLPVTVRAIEVAAAGKSDEIQIHGTEPSMLILVGVVENKAEQAACTEFILNDGTGRIRVKYFASGSENPFTGIEAGGYVCLAAQLRTSPEPHLSVQQARAVRTADEISYHMIECAHAMLKLRNGTAADVSTPEKKKISSTPEADLKISPPKVESNVSVMTQSQTLTMEPVQSQGAQALKEDALRAAILKHLQERQDTPEGTSLDQLHAKFSLNAATEIDRIMQALSESGDAYNTIDDNHFAII
jgi:replication factor A2